MKVLEETLKKPDNININSETGTGKTLANLLGLFGTGVKQPIIICSRTHDQLEHYLTELKKTNYS